MANSIRLLLAKLTANPKRLFLADASGAALTAFLSGVILVQFEPVFGMPRIILYVLALLACLYAVYSFGCFFFTPRNWRPFLKAIVFANIFYCCLTIALVCYHFHELTALGITYFLLETVVIGILVRIELLGLSGGNNLKR